jgi:hypothetical protein
MRARRAVRNILLTAAFAAGAVLVAPAAPASAVAYCDIGLVWQNAYVPGNGDLPFSPNCISAQGAGPNGAVQTLQLNLRDCHRKALDPDGHFGPITRRALTDVQKDLRIRADGVYGPQTARAMSHQIVGGGGCKKITF